MREIPFKDTPAFVEEVTLDGVLYKLTFHWNSRAAFWSVEFRDNDEELLVGVIKLVLGIELISDYPDRGLPPGQLYIIDEAEGQQEIAQDDFIGDRKLRLIYVEEEEVAQV